MEVEMEILLSLNAWEYVPRTPDMKYSLPLGPSCSSVDQTWNPRSSRLASARVVTVKLRVSMCLRRGRLSRSGRP
ncbi:hypothetical protein ACHAWF_004099 [Thalassiosira exigua]